MSGVWAVLGVFLFVVCAMLLVLEIFVPSFGLLTVLALACLAGGIMIFFQIGTTAGWVGCGIAGVLIPVVWIVVYKVFPMTPIGRARLMKKGDKATGDGIPDGQVLRALLGCEGAVWTPLRPVGICDFDGQRVECVAETGYIPKGRRVKVIEVEGVQVTVRLIETEE